MAVKQKSKRPSNLYCLLRILFNLWNPRKVCRICVNLKREEQKPGILTAMSDVVNYLDVYVKQELTIDDEKGVYTPQMSFMHVFNDFDLYFIDVDLFKYKFVEFYSIKGQSIFDDFFKSSVRNRDAVHDFWKKFTGLVNIHEYTNHNGVNCAYGMKDDAKVALLCQKVRRFFRVILSGTGLY